MNEFDRMTLRFLVCALWVGAEISRATERVSMDALREVGIRRLRPGEKASEVLSYLSELNGSRLSEAIAARR